MSISSAQNMESINSSRLLMGFTGVNKEKLCCSVHQSLCIDETVQLVQSSGLFR